MYGVQQEPWLSMKRSDKVVQIGYLYFNDSNSQAGRIYDKYGISPTLDSHRGGHKQPKIVVVYEAY